MYSAGQMCISGYERVDKRRARRLYNEGIELYMVPCNCSVHSMFTIRMGEYWDRDYPFDIVVNEFEWYNCNAETGKYTMFFIKDEA